MNSANDPSDTGTEMRKLSETESWTFDMGEHQAAFPKSFSFAKNHMWANRATGDGGQIWTFGLTEYAVRLLQDVYFLDWIVDPGATLKLRQTLGSIESKKAESDLFSPVAGKLVAINQEVLDEPSLINADPYGDGWLIQISGSADAEAELLSYEAYSDHLKEAWLVAQRTIKGQANE